ncbi:hypothetical protein GYMLUDRAFT_239634 [Collybiopsis luxurians FD-317 M1]|nr:hypothetical protein GYMLUDRAFT_239634 [Collybiopsis luxurians FD-317 M1]
MLLIKPGAWPLVFTTFWLLSTAILALASDENPQVQWISPSAGDVYGSGDSILAKWIADTAVVSPAFRLCPGQPQSSFGSRSENQGDDGSGETCGNKVYPTVQQSAGTYSASLAVPNTTEVRQWFLEMSDDFANTWSSSSFSISPSGTSNVASAAGVQAPLSATSVPTVLVPVTAVPVPVEVASSSNSASPILATRTPLPTAAFAVPLSIVGAILLVAAFLSFRHNRKLAQERAQDLEKLILSRKSSTASSCKSGFSRQSDIEHALNVLSKVQSQGEVKTMPVPLFMPVQVPVQPEPRRTTREAYQPKQYTEYYRPSQERSHRERPPSYRSAPAVSPASRSQSRARSLVASISSNSRASSRSAVNHPSDYPQHRPRHRASIRSYRSSHHLPSLRIGSSLHCSEYEYRGSEVDREWNRHSRSQSEEYEYSDEGDVECATHSVLDDYLFMDPAPKPRTLLPGLPNPPQCLMPAPQRLHVRNSGAISPRSYTIEEEEESMTEVDLYEAVANSLNRGRRG